MGKEVKKVGTPTFWMKVTPLPATSSLFTSLLLQQQTGDRQ